MPRSQGERRAWRRRRQPRMAIAGSMWAIATSFLLGEAARVPPQSFLMGDRSRDQRGSWSHLAAQKVARDGVRITRGGRPTTPKQSRTKKCPRFVLFSCRRHPLSCMNTNVSFCLRPIRIYIKFLGSEHRTLCNAMQTCHSLFNCSLLFF
jgi:hypothetical protein